MEENKSKNILLIGEFSGVHTHLKYGLLSHGVSAVIAGDGDVFKNFGMDIDLRAKSMNKYFKLIERLFIEIKFILTLKQNEFSCIQLMGPYALSEYLPFVFVRILRLKTDRLVLYAGGEDYYFWRAYRSGYFRYSICDVLSSPGNLSKFEYGILKRRNIKLSHFVDGIISGSVMYELGYRDHENYLGYLPFPMTIGSNIRRTKKNIRDSIKVVLPRQVGREREKGFHFFDQALQRFKSEFPDLIDVVEVQNESYEKYLELISGSDVLLDQLYGYDPGMNALVGLVNGLIVFGGQEPEYINAVGCSHQNLINVVPDSDRIYETMTKVLLDMKAFKPDSWKDSLSKSHDSKFVASRFLLLIQ